VLQSNISWNKLNYFKRSVSHYEGNVPQLNEIILQVQNNFRRNVEGVFLNYYENGNDYAPYHADKYNCDTCLISLGETRILRYKHNTTGENTDYNLANGDLLFIPDEINNNYKHSLLKRTKITKSRISILLFFK
jgi:alkylated DNA repair dioxygenase AlkB